MQADQTNWLELCDGAVAAINAAPSETTGQSPFDHCLHHAATSFEQQPFPVICTLQYERLPRDFQTAAGRNSKVWHLSQASIRL